MSIATVIRQGGTAQTLTLIRQGSTAQTLTLVRQGPAEQMLTVVGVRGPQGRPGPAGAGDDATFVRIAAGTLSALRVVWEDSAGAVRVLDYRDRAHIDRLAGITLTAAATAGQAVTMQRGGVLDAAGLGLAPGRVWLGADGGLTQTPPGDGFDLLVGCATAEQRLYLAFSEPIELE